LAGGVAIHLRLQLDQECFADWVVAVFDALFYGSNDRANMGV
jgi:hypothetical protein